MQNNYPRHPFCPRTPPYPPRYPEVPLVMIGRFYLYQTLAIGGGAFLATVVGSILPAIAAPAAVGLFLFVSQRWQRRAELERYGDEYYEFSRQRQFLWLVLDGEKEEQ